jgi:toxin FitB
MIILDTNVVSEVMRQRPEECILRWWHEQEPNDMYTTAITEAEIFAGIACAPEGARKRELGIAAEAIFATLEDRVLPFDRPAARAYGIYLAARRKAGRGVDGLDAQIAAIALAHDARICTRNVSDFESCGLRLVNPWDAA